MSCDMRQLEHGGPLLVLGLLALLRHTLLRRHGICALLCGLLLLEVGLVLERLLLIGGHSVRLLLLLLLLLAGHALWHGLHGCGVVRLLWRIDCGFAINTIGVGRLWRVKTCLE